MRIVTKFQGDDARRTGGAADSNKYTQNVKNRLSNISTKYENDRASTFLAI